MNDERREHHFRMHLPSGEIEDLDAPPVDEDDEEDWRPIGEIDPVTGRSTVDYSLARRWRPLSEFWRNPF
jgi:hypothetical protein